jgi:hypothetical protein
MRKKAKGKALSQAEDDRVKELEDLKTRAKNAVADKKDSDVTLRSAKRDEKTKKREADIDLRRFNKNKELDLTRSEEEELYALVYGDGMDEKKARRIAKKNRKDHKKRQKDVLDGNITSGLTPIELELVKSRDKGRKSGKDYAGAKFTKEYAKEYRDALRDKIENMRDE